MLATPHMLTGAAIGKVARRPWLAYPLAFASHFLLDWVPHLGYRTILAPNAAHATLFEGAGMAADTLFGAALVVALAWRSPYRRVILGGALFAILYSLLYVVPPWGPWLSRWPGTSWLAALDGLFPHGLPRSQWLFGIGDQLVVSIAAVALILRRASRPAPARQPQPKL